jgi:hypothetical protein
MGFNKAAQSQLTATMISNQPQSLLDSFNQALGPLKNIGSWPIMADAEQLLEWEKNVDSVFLEMSLPQLKQVLAHYNGKLSDLSEDPPHPVENERNKLFAVRSALESFIGRNPLVQKHLKYWEPMSNLHCDTRIAHLVIGGGYRTPQNTMEALEMAIQEENGLASEKKEAPKPTS